MRPTVLPSLSSAAWGHVDLDAEARAAFPARGPNPLLAPATCGLFVDALSRRMGVDHTWGGYLEDRSHLWRGHYHAPGAMRHLGVDLNAPAGTPVAVPAACVVTRVYRDGDQDGGWGGVAFLRLDAPHLGAAHLLLGHLSHHGLPDEGARLSPGDVLGRLGHPGENGGWYPHLHAQCFDEATFARFWPRLWEMDGYGTDGDGPIPSMPDPAHLVMTRG